MLKGWKSPLSGANARNAGGPSGAWDGMTIPRVGIDLNGALALGTLVGTSDGWRPVEEIRKGDRVMTFDNGLQTVETLRHGVLWNDGHGRPQRQWPLMVPKGALGNAHPLTLLPEQCVLIESDAAEDIYGDPFVLVPAQTLNGTLGIERVLPDGPQEAVMIGFERDEIVFVNGSALVLCPSQPAGAPIGLNELAEGGMMDAYSVLSEMEARAIVGQVAGAYA